jgi:putative ABC transport system permease protein
MFLLDIQPDQADGVRAFLAAANPVSAPRLLPVVRARVTGVQGSRVRLESFEDVRGQGSLAREYVMTYRLGLEANETVIGGTFWEPTSSPDPEVSIEESIHQRFRIDVGDRVRFDVLGRVVEARVSSIRRVEWGDARAGGFMFVFRPGVLEAAPQTSIAVLRGPADPSGRALLQRDVVARFPNVSVIDIRDVARTLQRVLDNVTLAVSTVGLVAMLSGVLILVGSVAMTKFQRLREAAIFKTLGASSRTLATMLAIEYSALGALAGSVGALAGLGLSWVVCRFLLEIPWHPVPLVSAVGLLATTLAVGVVGVLASVDVLRRKPLATLRAE